MFPGSGQINGLDDHADCNPDAPTRMSKKRSLTDHTLWSGRATLTCSSDCLKPSDLSFVASPESRPRMSITITALATQLLFVIFPGLVLHRALAVRLLTFDTARSSETEIRDSDLVLYGLLPALAIASEIGTVLSLLKLFRTEAFVAVMVAAVVWRRRDAAATLAGIRDLGWAMWQSLQRGELLTLVAAGIFLETAFGLLVYAQIPSEQIDVWHHQLPLAQSIVSHRGFVMPQIDNMWYGTYPIFFNMLFAEGLLFVNDVIAAKVINSLLYVGFLLSVWSCAVRARAFTALALSILIINNPFFSNGAMDAIIDVPRVSFAVLALVFAYRYMRDGRLYFLFAAGLLAGGAVAGKYTELLTPVLIGLPLLPGLLARRKASWIAVGVFAAAFMPIACYPYLRNLILLGNPIYPFYFGHPGLSDAYMSDLMTEQYTSIDPADRNLVNNLYSFQGWHDFFASIDKFFLSRWDKSYLAIGLIGAGLLIPGSYTVWLVVWTLLLAMVWHIAMYASMRWGLTAYMLMLTTSYLSCARMIDWAVATFKPLGGDWHGLSKIGVSDARLAALPKWLSPNNAWRIGLAGLALYVGFGAARHVRHDGWAGFLPGWAYRPVGKVILAGELDTWLAQYRKGYAIYRYIGEHDLKTVLQPLDNGAGFLVVAYNGGRQGDWILPWYRLPDSPAGFDEFLRTNNIRYFVYRASIDPVEAERLDDRSPHSRHIETAYELFRFMLPRSRRILVDSFGWELYAYDGARMSLK
jgi:hypothetical protein